MEKYWRRRVVDVAVQAFSAEKQKQLTHTASTIQNKKKIIHKLITRHFCWRGFFCRVAVVIVAVAAVTAADNRLTFKIKLKAVQTARELQISRTPTRSCYVDVDFHLGQHNARR